NLQPDHQQVSFGYTVIDVDALAVRLTNRMFTYSILLGCFEPSVFTPYMPISARILFLDPSTKKNVRCLTNDRGPLLKITWPSFLCSYSGAGTTFTRALDQCQKVTGL
ncbi:3727_t:CDS:2, partial [Acaulospora morrowiae]